MPTSTPIPPRSLWTVHDLEQLPDDGNRYEILHGELLVTPFPVVWHQRVAARLISTVGVWCNANRAWECFAPGGVFIGETSWLLPDLVVYAVHTSVPASDWRDMQPPALVMDVALGVSAVAQHQHCVGAEWRDITARDRHCGVVLLNSCACTAALNREAGLASRSIAL